ncbi:hypothetical protein SeMB42_g00560 [Synchytrium endobioticum]|uniref:Uncharacterized protein n=1 Tax=Synchytrium endobioticum TaxID=286115 RepID=A0A507DEE7_9FUNG|nr:hypothetical protein SeLEV6574_g01158 [Synchytrium endobioticum]TPX53887.1 hypothetical protein SeMB42_g00560 [Synchytrium endobioticum]
MSTLVTLGLVFAIPHIIGFVSRLRHKSTGTPTPAKKPRTTYDDACTFLLVATCLVFVGSAIFYPPPSLMKELGLSIDAPSFVVRNRFREFMNVNFQGWYEGWSNPINAPPGVIMVPARDSDAPQTPGWGTPEIRAKALYYERVAEKLKSDELRKLYHRYGESAVLGCTWCQEESDYFLWLTPSLGFVYGGVLILIGLTTMTRRKEAWRMYAVIACTALAVSESYIYMSTDIRILPGQTLVETLYEMIVFYRKVFLAILVLCVNFVDTGDDYSDLDLLDGIGMRTSTYFSRLVAARLARGVTLGDDQLRKRYFEYHKSINKGDTKDRL